VVVERSATDVVDFPFDWSCFMIVCLFAVSRFFGSGAGFCGRRSHGEMEDLRRRLEI